MQEREVHYLCVIPARQLRDVGKLLNIAKKHQLSTGRIYTTSIDAHYESESLGQYYVVSAKDVIVELVGLSGAITNSSSGVSGLQSRASRRSTTNDPFLAETEQKLREVSITHSSVEDIQVCCYLHSFMICFIVIIVFLMIFVGFIKSLSGIDCRFPMYIMSRETSYYEEATIG